MGSRKTLIHWFRQDLRVHDNPALAHIFALAHADPAKYSVRPIFILSSISNTESPSVGANRCRFLQQALEDLNKKLEKLNSRLYVVRGTAAEALPLLFLEWQNIECLTFETAIEPHAQDVDALITDLAEKQGIQVVQFFSRTLYNPENVLKINLGKAPLTYQKFLSLVENMKVPAPLEALERLPIETKPHKDAPEHKNPTCYDCPSIAELVKCPDKLGINKFPGGETEALQRLESTMQREQWLCDFEKNNTAPNSLEPSSTALSPYLNFGCLSTRLFYKRINDVLKKHPKHTKPPVSLLGQLLWREFYYTAAASEPNFDRMLGNSLCLQIPWTRNDEFLQAWTNGCTGYPFIDAIMRQLRQEGWIHHLARHAVACFLTRGDLWISWEEGERVFEELLIDYDWALNAANWMFLSASAFYHKYFHVYSPVAYGRKTDPKGNYIRKYVPELAKYPAGTIYEPWKVSEKAQYEYGCVLGVNYPHRIVQHETVHKENIKKMTAAYKVNKEVRTGKSEEICDEETVVGTKRKAKSTTASSKKTKRK